MRYGFDLPRLPSTCVCGSPFNVEHALTCNVGGFIYICHNDMRERTAKLLAEVCHNVAVEPELQPLTGEKLRYATAKREDEARIDVSARGFWVRGSRAFADIRIFNPLARSYKTRSLEAAYRQNENEKKRAYNQRVVEVEHGSFMPLVFSALGGMSKECERFYKQLAMKLSEKQDTPFSVVMNYVRTIINFSLLRAIGLCLRVSRRKRVRGRDVDAPVGVVLESATARM
jgi:hypothetical protein